MRFFAYLAHGLPGDRVGKAQLDHLGGEQTQRPPTVARGSWTAGNGEHMCFLFAGKLAALPKPWLLAERAVESRFPKPLADTTDGGRAHMQSACDLALGEPFVGFEQNAGPCDFAGSRFSTSKELEQLLPLLHCSINDVLGSRHGRILRYSWVCPDFT